MHFREVPILDELIVTGEVYMDSCGDYQARNVKMKIYLGSEWQELKPTKESIGYFHELLIDDYETWKAESSHVMKCVVV